MKAQKKRIATKAPDIQPNRSVASSGNALEHWIAGGATGTNRRFGSTWRERVSFRYAGQRAPFQFDQRSQRYRAGHGNEDEVRRFL